MVAYRTCRSPGLVFSALLALLAAASVLLVRPAPAQEIPVFRCGEHVLLTASWGELPREGLRPASLAKAAGQTTILLDAGPGLLAQPQALAAWEQAVSIWESVLHDPVTITIAGDFQSLGAGILGATSSRQFAASYEQIRDAVAADAAPDETLPAALPAAADVDVLLPAGFTYDGALSATKANLRALGFDMSFDDPNPDATIVFATGFLGSFDFDPSDGIEPGQLDFQAVVVHEIGHALGFVSRVDTVDFLTAQGQTGSIAPSTLDLFRLRAGEGAADFGGGSRLLLTGDLEPVHVFFDGLADLGLSTGVNLGDGRQASHWKADELTGAFLGIMDPTLSAGLRERLEDNDLRAFGLIGWDVRDATLADVPDLAASPAAPAFASIHPNPFNPRTTVAFRLEREADVRLAVFDLRGARVRTLLEERRPAGRHTVAWDGTDDAGRRAPSGLYLLRLEAGGRTDLAKIVLAK